MQGIAQSEELGTDGLWAKLRGGATRVVLLLADSVTGLLWPPGVPEREDQAAPWARLFERARSAGLDWHHIRGVTSDSAQGLSAFLRQTLAWVQHQRCVFHIWRNLAGQLAHAAAQAAAAATSDLAEQVREQVRAELVALIHGVIPVCEHSSQDQQAGPAQAASRPVMRRAPHRNPASSSSTAPGSRPATPGRCRCAREPAGGSRTASAAPRRQRLVSVMVSAPPSPAPARLPSRAAGLPDMFGG